MDGLVRFGGGAGTDLLKLVFEGIRAADNVYVKTPTTVVPAVRMAFEVE